ncbi:aminotransferase-like domain-containing protein [Chitinophaga nivalis]|uniref:PLP-dependent aminotransferase family protein n=1 Tax=Chitinophaga nivalis TaxID=2991709 RepID=A0ABT3IJ25_9BACT|nr:PLP-dependent aminotransferase family protein [Chitinophaga nivalis]MCW3466347.1 PLP-dependent aminotransferase family protein [Chitinophaga nivalis]MCW3483962.1 PLP-dependent aminotransferase family protein [Chitinophaga nivalis]
MKLYRYEAFASAIEKKIREGIYKPGQKLPSIRELKTQYQTSVSTIQLGYEHLIIKGLVDSVPKSGYYVSHKVWHPTKVRPERRLPVVRDAVFTHNLAWITSLRAGRHVVSEFNVAAPGDLMIPQKLLLRTMQQVIRECGSGLLRYYPPEGQLLLREEIVKRAATYNTRLQAQELLITDGALQALYVALAAVCAPGDVVAVESPCIFSALEVISMLQLKVIEIPMDSHTGFDIDYLRKACLKTTIKAILVTPNFQNPTGIAMPDTHKQALLAVAQQHGIALIENDIYGDLHFNGQRPVNIRSLDDSGLVMTYSGYAKTLAPGIRMGWLAPGKFFPKAERLKFALGSTVSPVYQETVYRLLQTGSYDRHVRTFRMQLAKNAYDTLHLLSAWFPSGTTVIPPAGGYNLWAQLPEKTDMERFYQRCEQIGVRFTPGYIFSFSSLFPRCFRMVFADKYSAGRKAAIRRAGQKAG